MSIYKKKVLKIYTPYGAAKKAYKKNQKENK
jgi:hypothetical protein